VWYDSGKVDELALRTLGSELPEAVAKSGLSLEDDHDWQLTPQDIEVFFSPYGPHDVTRGYDFLVIVQATSRPERQQRLKSARIAVSARIKAFIESGLKFGVWLQLVDAEWHESCTARRS